MAILRTERFSDLLARCAEEADSLTLVAAAARHVATLGGRFPAGLGMDALTAEERFLLESAEAAGATVHCTVAQRGIGDHMLITSTGRLRLVVAGEQTPDGAVFVGNVDWHGNRPADLDDEFTHRRYTSLASREAVKKWLVAEGTDRALDLIRKLRHTFRHVGPMLVHVGDRHYTNLGKASNLVGKSVGVDSEKCLLNVLEGTPLLEWSDEDCTFLTLMSILIASGTPSRTEEFSGTQLSTARLESFIRGRVQAYSREVPESVEGLPEIERLWSLAAISCGARESAMASGVPVYRVIQGMTINKEERLLGTPVGAADLPDSFSRLLRPYLTGAQLDGVGDPTALAGAWAPHIAGLHEPADSGFSTRFEELLHELVAAATSATRSHVGMSRGPKDVGLLGRLLAQGDPAPGKWKTSDYYCCVVPSAEFVDRFSAGPESLVQVVRAIAARMRWNGWHFMPPVAGPGELFEDRDWFFPPSMPDITEWTSHHHQGHVANGVRHAIRVPLPLVLAGATRPGIHDFRLMRSDGDPYDLTDLRAAIAVARVLQSLYQAHARELETSSAGLVVSDFGNRWYQARYQVTPETGPAGAAAPSV
ncbi:hypothetical protein [Streptomyces sp. LN785]|uniref:hypothetical protein n=1 Tax=Streptomyces sp. LN785 TaxID=3112983 RepID=UPI00371AF9BA